MTFNRLFWDRTRMYDAFYTFGCNEFWTIQNIYLQFLSEKRYEMFRYEIGWWRLIIVVSF